MAECQEGPLKRERSREDEEGDCDDDKSATTKSRNDATSNGNTKPNLEQDKHAQKQADQKSKCAKSDENKIEESQVQASHAESQGKSNGNASSGQGRNDKAKAQSQGNSQAETALVGHPSAETTRHVEGSQIISNSNHGATDAGQVKTNDSRPKRTYSDAVSLTRHPGNYNLRTPLQSMKIDFHLLILGDYSVETAYILCRGEIAPLEPVLGCSGLWRCVLILDGDPIRDRFKYKYGFHRKGHDFKVPYFGRIALFSKDSSYCEEACDRHVESKVQYDVFHFPENTKYFHETIPQSIIFYLHWLLPAVSPSTICEILNQIESFSFTRFSRKHMKQCVNWIVENAVSYSVTDVQRLYLCIVLSYLDPSSSFPIQSDHKTADACDRLLQCLNACVYSNFLSPSNLQKLKKIAVVVVKNSNSPGWLTLAAHFYPYLGIEFLLSKKYAAGLSCRYDARYYQKMVGALFVNIKIENHDEQISHRSLLDSVLKCAPTLDAALELLEHSDVCPFFTDDDDRVDFFVEFYQGRSEVASTRTKSVGEKLVEVCRIPDKIRCKLHKLMCSTLLEFAKSDEELKGEHVKIFVKIISEKDVGMDDALQLLLELSKSKSVPRHSLVLEILNNGLFEQDWRGTQLAKKVDACRSWVITKVMRHERRNSAGVVDRTVAVYEAINSIMSCSLNISNKALAHEVSTSLVETVLRDENTLSVLKAFSSIDKYVSVVQECYKSHVRKLLKKTPKVVKKSSKFLEECSSSRLGQELLSCILDIVNVPAISQDNTIEEDHFKTVLEWCDVWIILLKTTGTVEDNKKYKSGKKICQNLEMHIKEGNISLSFLDAFEEEKEKISMLCATVLAKSQPKSDPDILQKQILDRVNELVNIVLDCSEKIQLLESAIKYGKKISNDVGPVNGIDTIIETLSEMKDTLRTRRVCELTVETFWGTLHPLLNPAEALQPLVKSLSFMTVAKKGLKESNPSESADESEQIAVKDFYSLIEFLTTQAIVELQTQWNPVLNNPGSLSVESMKALLGPLKDQNRLDEELTLLEKYFRRQFSPNVKLYIEDYVKYPAILAQVRHVIGVLKIFGLADSSNETIAVLLQFQTILENSNELTLATLHQSVKDVKQIVSAFTGEKLDVVIKELSKSSELLRFIEEIVDEDIRFLIDAVEEHSDQFVSESSVSDLIDVHGFLAPLIKKKNQKKCNTQNFLNMLKSSCLEHKGIAVKIQQCSKNVNSLRGLYTSIANRGEITKEIISNCLKNGFYWVSVQDGTCEAKMSYLLQASGEEKTCNYSLSDLHDLRSRAHLIVSSHKNAFKAPSSHRGSEDIDFDNFIDQINLLTEISILLSKLHSSGYVKYRRFWKRMTTTNDLQSTRDNLQEDLNNWENILTEAREKFYFLNFYRSDQLCTLYDFLTKESKINCDEVLPLIHFVYQTITKLQLEQHLKSQKKLYKPNPNVSADVLVTCVGQALESIFNDSKRVIRWVPGDDQSLSYSKLEDTVTPGEIFVASLETDSPLTANVILTLYENTSNAFPEPYQVVFCSPQTTWEELHLLLQRCFAHSAEYSHHNSLFCIANVELLPNELQFKLVNAIKKRLKCYQSSETIQENANYRLALICRGGDHHHIVEQFAQHSHRIAGMSDHALSYRLKSGWPHVKMITSTLPGLGKTEHIKREVLKKNMNVATFSISGPFEANKVIQRLNKLNLKKYHCLHLDIGEVSDPLLLDTFLFQLIVTGMVSAGTQFYRLPTTHIYIEIANTLKDSLRESLVVSQYFTRIHLEWQNYKDLLVSPEITSNVQVVCQYLDIFERARIESTEVHFNGPKEAKPLPTRRCQELLAKYFSSDADITFTALNTFLRVFADQLLKFSRSAFSRLQILSQCWTKKPRVSALIFFVPC